MNGPFRPNDYHIGSSLWKYETITRTSVIHSFIDSPIVPSYYFGWNTYDSSDKSTYPERDENGNSSWGGDTHIDFPIYFGESVLE